MQQIASTPRLISTPLNVHEIGPPTENLILEYNVWSNVEKISSEE